jgi:very-short-patch-repair endonuclease
VRKCSCSCNAYTAKKNNRACRLCQSQAESRTQHHDDAVRYFVATLTDSKLHKAVCVLELDIFQPGTAREAGKFVRKQPCFRADIVVVCEDLVCVVEVDGAEHRSKQQQHCADTAKDSLLKDLKVPVVRLPISKGDDDASRSQAIAQAVEEVCAAYRDRV